MVFKTILIGATILSAAAASAQTQNFGGWTMSFGSSGSITAMTYANPPTQLRIEKQLQIDLDAQGTPSGGTVVFHNGVQRELKPGELTYFWNAYDGRRFLWVYWESKDKVAIFNARSGPIPGDLFSRTVRVTTTGGLELFGTMKKNPASSDGFHLAVEGACCGPIQFERIAVSNIAYLK